MGEVTREDERERGDKGQRQEDWEYPGGGKSFGRKSDLGEGPGQYKGIHTDRVT